MKIFSLFFLRVALGMMFFYAGITKVVDPTWSAYGYLMNAKTFPGLFQWFASPGMLPLINVANEWGLTLIGVALLLGIGVRIASMGGALLMVLYYLPILDGVYPNTHSLIVDEHVIYFASFLILIAFKAGRVYGLEKWLHALPFWSRNPKIRAILE
ncbi:MAG: hypothetical protein COV91_05150 [Candidatus Taylorbacteria bacterium CG11_big_fil_rev_8_21_14_0_20_46_11]|uniref:DoxX family protein n=1 Tax=Candidatus Taylorbacteria bacterium CG11_big_fil_rev_8_21_14_0_20_46_11 TaxID=1975025 RepID=A0A2H0KAF3_9BACT|nr:MAG: hypothetical protein COV91_05150 [Candidatus Taylorbacteria bacterium CG11_big_fil_rev_8_21_14_0_20_46_11]